MFTKQNRFYKKKDPTSAPFLLDLRLNDVRFFFLLDFSEDWRKEGSRRNVNRHTCVYSRMNFSSQMLVLMAVKVRELSQLGYTTSDAQRVGGLAQTSQW